MLKAKDIMTRDVITVEEKHTIRELASLFLSRGISGAPVIDGKGKVVGVVTESDLIFQNKKVHLPTTFALLDAFVFLEGTDKTEKELKKIAAYHIGDICTKEFTKVDPETSLEDLATLMSDRHIHTLPVMEGEKLVGIIGKSDIIRTIAQGL